MSNQSITVIGFPRGLLVTMALCLFGNSCGTEVGNGHSGPPKHGGNASSDGGSPDENGPAGSSQGTGQSGAGSPDAITSSAQPPLDFKDLISVVLNSCASPFATSVELAPKAYDYVPEEAAAKSRLTVDPTTLDPAIKLTLTSENGFQGNFSATRLTVDTVNVVDLAGKPFATPFTCKGSTVVTDEALPGYAKPVKAHRATLTNKDAPGDMLLDWFVDATNPENPLRRIEIKKENTKLTLLPAPK